MKIILLIITLFSTFIITSASEPECLSIGTPCLKDCDCCGNDEKPAVKCERRNHMIGRRCFRSGSLYAKCTHDSHCRSQKCGPQGFCVPFFDRPPKVEKCLMEVKNTYPIKGTIQENICNCPAPEDPTIFDALNAIDSNLATTYVNSYAIDGGLEIEPKIKEGTLRYLEVCNNEDSPESDPLCYKVEGYCEHTGYEVIGEGDLPMPLERGKCVKVPIAGKSLYTKYKVTFPCQRGGCRDSCGDWCRGQPVRDLKPNQCPDYVDDGENEILEFLLDSYSYNTTSDLTHYYYHLNTTAKSQKIEYLMMQWSGDCSVVQYNVYSDVNLNKRFDDEDICCFRKCGSDFLYLEEDWSLCMEGLEIYSANLRHTGLFFVHLSVAGNNGFEPVQYGAVARSGHTEYGMVDSPKCSDVACPSTCPLKVSQINLLTNCNEVL